MQVSNCDRETAKIRTNHAVVSIRRGRGVPVHLLLLLLLVLLMVLLQQLLLLKLLLLLLLHLLLLYRLEVQKGQRILRL